MEYVDGLNRQESDTGITEFSTLSNDLFLGE